MSPVRIQPTDPSSDPPALHRVPEAARGKTPPEQGLQQLWFLLARREWRSLAVVPADAGGSANEIAKGLAEVAGMLHEPVTLLGADSNERPVAPRSAVSASNEPPPGPRLVDHDSRVIVCLRPIITEPLGLMIAAAADTIVLCVELGRSRLWATSRTAELLGRDRIAGCVLVC